MKDNTTSKLVFAIVLVAALGFAVWSGLSTTVEVPAAAAHQGAFATPF